MHTKNSFHSFQSTRDTPLFQKTRNQVTLSRQTFFVFRQSRSQRQCIRAFAYSEKFENHESGEMKKLSNSTQNHVNAPIHSLSNLVLESENAPLTGGGRFETWTPPSTQPPISNSFFAASKAHNALIDLEKQERPIQLTSSQSVQESQEIFETNSQTTYTQNLLFEEQNPAREGQEMSEPTVSNLRARNILRFLFTVITGHDSSGKTLSVSGGVFSQNIFAQNSGTQRSIGNNGTSHRVEGKLRPYFKAFKSYAFRGSKQSLIWKSLLVFSILGLPVLLGCTLRITTSSRGQPALPSVTTLSFPGEAQRNLLEEKKSDLFHGLIPAPKCAFGFLSKADSTGSASDSTSSNFPGVAFTEFSPLVPVRENILRLPEYGSKLFIIWGLLYIWKGVRPQRRTLKDFHGDDIARVIWPNRPSGGLRRFLGFTGGSPNTSQGAFSNLQGLTAYLPVLETLIQSLQVRNAKWMPMDQARGQKRAHVPGRHPKGYLFVGPPGTGKTLLAQALASEAQVPLLCLSASEIQKQIEIGTRIGALRLRKLFDQARRLAPCILFLDEIDAIGKYRGGEAPRGADNGFQKLGEGGVSQNPNSGSGKSSDLKLFTEFLVQMDELAGPGTSDGFVVIGTTNFLSNLDSAFIRSGRFDRILALNYPSKKVRVDILKWYCGASLQTASSGIEHEKNSTMGWNYFGHYTHHYSPADLARLVNESLLYQITKGKITSAASSRKSPQIHSFESLQKGFNRIQSHKKDLSGEGNPSSQN